MGGWGGESQLRQSAKNPASPAGLRQTQTRQANDQQNFREGRSVLRPWGPQNSQLETAKSWYTGANNEGTKNGWDTTFQQNMFKQQAEYQNQAAANGRPSQFYDWLNPNKNKQATGVQTWGEDPLTNTNKEASRFGDVYNNGEKVGNVYDDHPGDRATADVLMGEYLFSNDEKARAWKTPGMDVDGKPTLNPEYTSMVDQARARNTELFIKAPKAEAYQEKLNEQEAALRKGAGDELTVLGGIAGGAALGAGIGAGSTIWSGPGAAVGAAVGGAIGAVVGGVSAYLNQDELVEMEAHAKVQADKANEKYGDAFIRRSVMQVGEYAALGMKFISPVTNMSRGVQDARLGEVGDMTAEFHETDKEGDRKVGKISQALDLGATLADGVLQFASPVGRFLSTGLQTTVAVGGVGELATGSVFNERIGEFDKLDSASEVFGATASVAIDAVQAGASGAFAKAGASSRAAFTGEVRDRGLVTETASKAIRKLTGKEAAVTRTLGEQITGRNMTNAKALGRRAQGEEAGVIDRAWAGVRGRKGLETAETVNGIRFAKDASGKVVSTRVTMELLAPSESLRWIETGWRARRLARADGGELTRDHFLKAAIDMQSNSRFRQAVLLGYTEGGEEFAQAWLDPMSVGERGNFADAAEAALYGAAGGIGMGLGPMGRQATNKQQMEARAFAQRAVQLGRVPTPEEWAADTKGFTQKDFEKMARTDPQENQNTNDMLSQFTDNLQQENAVHSSMGVYRMDAINQKRFESLHRKALEEGNGSLVLLGQSTKYITTPQGTIDKSAYASSAGVMSFDETINQLGLIAKGTSAQLRKVEEELKALPAATQAIGARGLPTVPDSHIEDLRREYTARREDLLAQEDIATQISNHFLNRYNEFTQEANPTMDQLAKHIERMNAELNTAYTGHWRDENGTLLSPEQQKRVQRAVELKLGRHPFQDKGSFAVVVPQVSLELTRLNASGQLHVQQGMLKAINGDHDGDTIMPLHTTYLDEEALARVRRGDQYLQPVEDENGKTKVQVVIAAPSSEHMMLRSFSEAMLDPLSQSADEVTRRLDELVNNIKAEFSQIGKGPLDNTELEKLLVKFKESVQAGREDARMNLVTAMVNLDYPGMRSYTPDDNTPSVQWLWTQINQTWDILSKDLAHVRAGESTKPTITPGREAAETKIRSEIARADAATASATLGLLTSDAVRGAQHLHYSVLFRGLTEFDPNASMTTDQQKRLTQLFMELGNSQTQRDIELLTQRNAVEERVYYWLSRMANEQRDTSQTTPEVMLLLANMAVPDVSMTKMNTFEVKTGEITLLQLLLRKSLDIEEAQHPAAEQDSAEMKKIRQLRRYTYKESGPGKRSTTASLAMIEVLGNRPLFELIGNSSAYVGPQLTLNQLVQQQRGLHPNERNKTFERLKRLPPYLKTKERGFKDAPWPLEALTDTDTKISAYAIVMDAVKVAGDTYFARMESRNKTVQDAFDAGLEGLHEAMDAHKRMHSERLAKEGIKSDIQVLRDTLRYDPRLAQELATSLIPDAAALGVFQIHPSGKVTAAKWLEKMLVTRDRKRAGAMYYFNIKVAELIQRAGTISISNEDFEDLENAKDKLALEDIRGRIDPASIDSRFLQVFIHLASQHDNIELFRFIRAMESAPSVDAMFETLNNEPMWRNNQEKLLAWYDDVSDFEVDPSHTWTANMDGALQRENLRGWGQRMQVIGSAATEAAVTFEATKNLLHGIEQAQLSDNAIDMNDGVTYRGLLKRTVENRKRIPDYQGQAARTQLFELQMMGVAAVHNKGVADDRAAPFGEPLITLDSFGYVDGLRQEINSVTREDVEDVMTNLSKLAQGPVDLHMPDGRILTFDISDEFKALQMLQDPRTQGLAMSILFPTVRDVDSNNTVQVYLDTDAKTDSNNRGNLAQLLRESNFTHLYEKQPDFESELKQAHRYIGTVEAIVRAEAVGNTDPAVQDKSFMPLQKMMHDLIAAYLHSMDVDEANYPHIRDRMFIDVANAHKAICSVKRAARPKLQDLVAAIMQDRFMADPTALNKLLNDDVVTEQLEQIAMVTQQAEIYQQGLDDIDTRHAKADTPAKREEIEQERADYVREWEHLHGKFGYEHLTFLDAVSALSMFKVAGDSTDQYNIAEILTYLGQANRINRVFRKDTYEVNGIKVNAQALYDKYRKIYDENPGNQEYAPEEMEVLANWAAQIYLEDTTSRASSSVPSGPPWLGEEGQAVKRYSDQSFTYLLDPLFDDAVMRAGEYLSEQASYYPNRDAQDVAKELTNGILSDKKLGTWNRVIVNESMKARMILKNSTVGAAVAQGGNTPKVMADYLGAGKITWQRPNEAHFSDAVLTGSEGQRLADLLTDPVALAKLSNHFVTEVTIESADPNKPLDPAMTNAFAESTWVNETNEDTRDAGRLNSGYPPLRVLDLSKLDGQIEWLKNSHGLGAYTVKIKYVDVNKQPHKREWANNIFFDGVGREAVGGSSMGTIASLFFGLGGLNKVFQQIPLDAATKKGMQFRPHQRSTKEEVDNLQQPGMTVAQVMAAKTDHVMNKHYPMGDLLEADRTSIYKLMKMRHVVIGFDANGNKQVRWAADVIQEEEAGTTAFLDNGWKLVALGDRETMTLLGMSGAAGVRGTSGSLQRPTFNIQDLDTFPDLSPERLKRLGMEGLGEDVEVGNTVLAQVNYPAREVSMYKRGEEYPSKIKQREEAWHGEVQEVHTRRAGFRGEGKGKLDILENNQVKSQTLIDMLSIEEQGLKAQKLGIPKRGVLDMAALQVSRQIAAQLSHRLEYPNSMIWVHKQGADGGDLTRGLVGRADLKNNFAGMNGMGPVFGDYVVLDLADLMATVDTQSYERAAEIAADILKTYAKRGVNIVLQATGGQLDLRAKVTEDLTDGSLGYRAMAGSPHFFSPITGDADTNAAQRALSSSLLETQQWTTPNMALRFLVDSATDLSEQTEYIDTQHDRAYNVISHTILPHRMTSTGSVGKPMPMAYGEPQRGIGQGDQLEKVNAQLLPLLSNPEGREYLKGLFLGRDKNGNLREEKIRTSPMEDGYPRYIEHPNGTISHGVLSLDDALDKLQSTIEANKWPGDKGEVGGWGTIIPWVSGDGTIHLSRMGFQQPRHDQIEAQWKQRYGDKNRRISTSIEKLDKNQTLPPPFRIDEVRSDARGISIYGKYQPNPLAKSVDEGLGLKTGQVPMPGGFSFPDNDIAAPGAAGIRPTRMMNTADVIGKEATGGIMNNFRDIFMMTGINFEDDMINFFFGDAPRTEEKRDELWDLTSRILTDWSLADHRYTETDIARMLDNRSALLTLELQLNATGRTVAGAQWNDVSFRAPQGTEQSANARLATVLLATLAAPGVRLEHVISTAGSSTVSDHNSGYLVRQMPALMTDALNDIDHPALREMLIARANRNMPVDPVTGEPEMWFDNQLRFHIMMTQQTQGGPRKEEYVGWLQSHVPLPADENSIRNTYAGIDSSGAESQHVANTIAASIGGRVATATRKNAHLPDALEELYGNNEIERFKDADDAASAFFHVITRLRTHVKPYNQWQKVTPMEAQHHTRMQGKLRQYAYEGDRTPETGWSEQERTQGDALAMELLALVNIEDGKATRLVEEMARQLMGLPGPAQGQTDYHERLTFEIFQTAVEYMKRNVAKGYMPTYGGSVPLLHEMTLKRIFDAQKGAAKPWLPLANGNQKGKEYAKVDDWGTWVGSVMGQMRYSEKVFDAMFRTDLDAFFNTYQGTHPDYMSMAISTDQQVMLKLLDKETNRAFMSVDPGYDAVLEEPIVLTSQYMTYDALVGKGAVVQEGIAEEVSDSVIARRIKTMKDWQEREGLPKQKDTSVRDYMRQGAMYQESSSSTTNLMRNLVNASVMVRLFNPALYVSAAVEVPVRKGIEDVKTLLTGQMTGRAGKAVARLADKLSTEGMDLRPRYSVEDIEILDNLNSVMGSSNQFKGMVFQELAYQSAIAGGRGKVGGLLERGAAGAALTTADPFRGLPQPTLAKRYNDAAIAYLTEMNAQFNLRQYDWHMRHDPTWLSRNDPTAHRMAQNAVNQARGAKNTMLSTVLMAPIDMMTKNKNLPVNFAGHLLKLPFLFTRFNANMFITLTGLHGFDQAAAMFFDGRKKPKLIQRMQNRAKQDGESANSAEHWDLSDVLEAIDLSELFMRNAATHTAIFGLAMMAQGLSLGGEDEEEKRRKKMAEYLHTPYYYDPRRASNDWRWKDAIFLDNVPVLGNIYMEDKDQGLLATAVDTLTKTGEKKGGLLTNETTHAAVVPHWIFRQFLSPVLGTMRFFETGNFDEVRQGFRDAASVIPTSTLRLWDDADMTADLLLEAAEDDGLVVEKQSKISQLAMNAAFVYEKALIENSFINGLYQAGDKFDRNPYAVVQMKNGEIVRGDDNEPLASEALNRKVNEQGEIRDKYQTYSNREALMHQYAEGNATAAALLSILPFVQGQESTYWRGNMAVKKQYVQLAETPEKDMKSLVYAAWEGAGGQDTLTKEEIIKTIKQREQAAGRWWKQDEVEAEADKVYATMKDRPLSIFGKDGKEIMTQEGKNGVFRSLRDGVIKLDDPAIQGFHMTQAERDKLAEEMTTELVEEGIALGLSQESAQYRMRRLWYGDRSTGAKGLKWALYDKNIPSKPYAEYNQLNVTYTLGPDGKPWATPFERQKVLQILGLPFSSKMAPTTPGVTSLDERGNVIDLVRGINTGLAAIEPGPVASDIKANDDAVKKAEAKEYTPGKKGYTRRPWRNFGRRRFGGFGGFGGGGGGGGGRPYFVPLRALPEGTSARADDIPMINTSTPIIRRADVRRERITSERGRLKQWQ